MGILDDIQIGTDKELSANNGRTKLYDPSVEERTIRNAPDQQERTRPVAPFILQYAHVADQFIPWGTNITGRDAQLRQFWVTESILSSAVYSTALRNASFEWEIVNRNPEEEPHKRTIRAATDMLRNSDRGSGWWRWIIKMSVDYYTQDNGAFVEVIRREDHPQAAVLNLAHIDSARCQRTGDPEYPVIYTDRHGIQHVLQWYQVITLEDFPSAVETLYGVQVSAVSRALRAAQVIRDISVYKQEKVSGRFSGALHFVGGISQSEVEDVIREHEENMDNRSLLRYSPPVVLAGIDPTHPVSHVQVDLASLPDNFDEDTTYRWYIAQLALAFGVDYQEFAPLPSRSMGSSQESEILHMKTRGKGPAAFMNLVEFMINGSNVLPPTVKFQFKLQDIRAETEKADARFTRGKDRALRLKNGELDGQAARELAMLDGDLPPHIAESMEARGMEEVEVEAPGVQLGGDSFTGEQIESGIESHDERKAADIERAERMHVLRQQGTITLPEGLEITEEEIEIQRRLMRNGGGY